MNDKIIVFGNCAKMNMRCFYFTINFLQYEESDIVLDNKVWGLDHNQKKIVFLEKIISSSRKKIDDNKKPNNKKVR